MTDPSIESETLVYFFKGPPPDLSPSRVLFDNEKVLKQFLVQNFEHSAAFRGLRLRARQFRFADSHRTINMLCEVRKSRELVGIELKCGAPDRGLPTQMIDYLIELERLSIKEGRAGFRGIVVTGQPDERIQDDLEALARQRGYRVEWLLYESHLKLRFASEHRAR